MVCKNLINTYVCCRSLKYGGSSFVIKKIATSDNHIFSIDDYGLFGAIFKASKTNEPVIYCQPMGILVGIIVYIVFRKKGYFIFDSHPFGFKSFIKRASYFLMAFFLFIFYERMRLVIPDGPLALVYPFNTFKKASWNSFVTPKFREYIWSNSQESVKVNYLFYGNLTAEKGWDKFKHLVDRSILNANHFRASAFGYHDERLILKNIDILESLDSSSDNFLLLWFSRHESYGLVFREFVESSVPVVFFRERIYGDNILNGIYVKSDYIDLDLEKILIKILTCFQQKNLTGNHICGDLNFD